MGFSVREILVMYDRGSSHNFEHYAYKAPFNAPYAVGEFQDFIPTFKRKLVEHGQIEAPLFNTSCRTMIPVAVGKWGMFYLKLRPMHVLTEIFVDPENIDVSLCFGEDSLIYAFYNNTRRPTFNVSARIGEDEEEVFAKLKSDPKDELLYMLYVRKALARSSRLNEEMLKAEAVMTAEQLAQYAKVGLQTIRNMTSNGEIPFVKSGRAVRYRKDEVDEWMKAHRVGRTKPLQRKKA
jgi:excisionase family DNA binding protein